MGLLYSNLDMQGIMTRICCDLTKIKESLLVPWQKLDAIHNFIQPCLTYILRAYPVTKDSLTPYRRLLVATLRHICCLPKRARAPRTFSLYVGLGVFVFKTPFMKGMSRP